LKKNPILIVLVILNTLGVLLLILSQNRLDEKMIAVSQEYAETKVEPVEIVKKKIKEGHILSEIKLPPIAANLAKISGPQRYVKINIVFEMETPSQAQNLEIISKMPTIRDEIIRYLNRKTQQDVLKHAGKEVIKNDIIDFSNKLLSRDHVLDIYFTRFEVN